MGRRRSVIKDMPQVGIATAAEHFGPPHAKSAVIFGSDTFPGNRRPKTWPARSGIEFRLRTKEFIAAASAAVNAVVVLIPVFSAKRRLGPLLSSDIKLLVTQFLLPLGIGLFDLFHRFVLPTCFRPGR